MQRPLTEINNYKEKHDNYENYFIPQEYMRFWNALSLDKEKADSELRVGQSRMRFNIRAVNDFLALICRRNQNNKIHDLGCGPSLMSMLSAAAFPQITSIEGSDFLSSNLNYLKTSLNSKGKEGYNYSKIIEFINSMHEKREHLSSDDYFVELNKKCQLDNILKCDLSLDDIFCGKEIQWGTYDAVVSTMTLTDAVPNEDAYKNVLMKVNQMLRKGGALCLLDLFNQSFWYPSLKTKDKLCAVNITPRFLEQCLVEAGFLIEEMRLMYFDEKHCSHGEGAVCVRATKK
uniref:Phenylethanolamine N methyltransferase 1 n=1 Tax=Hofstenia miamia TaxID=442651 RepID=A0A7G7LK78_HOFMI|nr:phenylethanolamine N methyltransferase 1 [Hofstenia miamia]